MWCKSAWTRQGCVANRVRKTVNRNARLSSSRGPSYLHNPGTAPLVHQTAGEVLRLGAERWPGRPALRSVQQDITLTYSQLLEQADALGCALRDSGLARGDRLGVWAHNCAEWVVVLAAAARVGLVPVALNPVYVLSELSFSIKKVGLRAIVIGDAVEKRNYYSMLNQLIPELATSKPGELNSASFPKLKAVISMSREKLPGSFSYKQLISDYSAPSKSEASKYSYEVRPEDGFIIHFTSGTTGEPKAALGSHFSVVNNSYLLGKRTTLHAGHEKICVQVPMFHAFGTIITTMAALNHGSTLVLPSALYSPSANVRSLYSEGCTVIHGTPTMFVDAVSQLRSAHLPPPSLRVSLTAGAPCSPQLFNNIKKYLNVHTVKSLFGLTETTAGVFQSLEGESMEKATETVGCVHEHIEVKIVDEQNNVVPFGSPGELLVRGYSTMMGYWDEPEKTRQTISEDRWLRTGDQFAIDEDGYGRIVGRLKDIIVRGGENIYPKEIEDLLNTHPDIIESQVFGVADERLGEEVCAAVRLREGAALAQREVATHCRDRLAPYKTPRLLRVVDQFPKTASGKIQKFKLREMVESGKL